MLRDTTTIVGAHTTELYDLYEKKDVVPISIFWRVKQYFIIGAVEVFTFVGLIELSYDQVPDAMRSMCFTVSLTTIALGS
jgi:solute carrier family 15 (peptide/histidine transporter), member 3/4